MLRLSCSVASLSLSNNILFIYYYYFIEIIFEQILTSFLTAFAGYAMDIFFDLPQLRYVLRLSAFYVLGGSLWSFGELSVYNGQCKMLQVFVDELCLESNPEDFLECCRKCTQNFDQCYK